MTEPVPEPDPRDRSTKARRGSVAVAVAGSVLGLVAAGLVVRELVLQWGPASDAIAGASVGWLAVSVLTGVLAMVLVAWTWADVMATLGATPARTSTLRWFFVGELGKYLPGGVWAVLGRGELARRGGVPATVAYSSVVLSLITLYLAAAVAAALLVPLDLAAQTDDPRAAFGLIVVIGGGVVLLHPRTLQMVLRYGRRISGRGLEVELPSGRVIALLVLRYLPSWLLVGFATWSIARALDPGASLPRVMLAAIVSWIAGFLAVPVPAGGGIREAVFLAVAGLSGGIGAATAIAARLLFVAVDGGGALVSTLTGRRRMLAASPGSD